MRIFLLEQACTGESAVSPVWCSEGETTWSSGWGAARKEPREATKVQVNNGFESNVKGLGLPSDFSNFSYLVHMFIRFLRRFSFFHCILHP